MRLQNIIWIMAMIFLATTVFADIDYFTDRMNFPTDGARTHKINLTNTGSETVIVNVSLPTAFVAIGSGGDGFCAFPAPGTHYSCTLASGATKYVIINSTNSCTEGTTYTSSLTGNNTFSADVTFVCIPDNKIVDCKIEYGHGDANYLDQPYISNETVTLFDLTRVWNIGHYLSPDEAAINATTKCTYPRLPVRTYGRVEIDYGTDHINGTFLWNTIESGYWFRIGVVSQDLNNYNNSDVYNFTCQNLTYDFEHHKVQAEYSGCGLEVRTQEPFFITVSNHSDPTKATLTIKNTEKYSTHHITFDRLLNDYTYTEYYQELWPNEQVSYVIDRTSDCNLELFFIPSWYKNSRNPKYYKQEYNCSAYNTTPVLHPIGDQTVYVGDEFFYDVNATDADGDILTYSSNSTLFTIGLSTGLINFTPNSSQIGNHSINISVRDPSNKVDWEVINLEIKTVPTANDPPTFSGTISNQEWLMNINNTDAFDLDTYFSDPDGDNLTFTYTQPDNITINISSDNKVTFIPDQGWNGTQYVIFYANDSQNNLTDSNNVTLRVYVCGDGTCDSAESCSSCPADCGTCPIPTPPSGNGGGGGGGGGRIIKTQCNDREDNDNDTLVDYPSDPGCSSRYDEDEIDCYIDSDCRDLFNNTDLSCVEHTCIELDICNNCRKDLGEQGIDCGGICPRCSTCSDGAKNCIKLENCSYVCEEGIDCGGQCDPCPTCFDEIQNYQMIEDGFMVWEEGIDCGGPCEKACPVEKKPEVREPVEICIKPECESKIRSSTILLWLAAALFIIIIIETTVITLLTHKDKKRYLAKIKRIERSPGLNLFAILLLFLSAFLIWVFDKGCYECNIIHAKWILIGFIFVLIAILLHNIYRIINPVPVKSWMSRACKALTFAALLLMLATFMHFNYSGCPASTCSDGIMNQEESWIDCGGTCDACDWSLCTPEVDQEKWILILFIVLFVAILLDCLYKEYIGKRRKKDRLERIRNSIRIRLFLIYLALIGIFLTFVFDLGCSCRTIKPSWAIVSVLFVLIFYLGIGIHRKILGRESKTRFRGCSNIILLPLILILTVLSYTYYPGCPEPSCSDGILNQLEMRIDCGGSCGPCDPCLVEEQPADLCGIPPWQVNIILLIIVFFAFFFDYIIYLMARRRKKEFTNYEYFKNSHLFNFLISVILVMVLFSSLILDRGCFECRQVKSAYLLGLTILLMICFMAYRLYSRARDFQFYRKKGTRLFIVLFLVVIGVAGLFYLYAYCPASTCADGIQNQMERGIDCGGPCDPCTEQYINPYIIAFLLGFLLSAIVFYVLRVYYKYARLRRMYNIELCPRCGTHMHRKGWLSAGIAGGKRTVYRCPRCKYRCIRNERELNLKESICQECGIEMLSKDIRMLGRKIGKIYTCPKCKQKRIRIKFFK